MNGSKPQSGKTVNDHVASGVEMSVIPRVEFIFASNGDRGEFKACPQQPGAMTQMTTACLLDFMVGADCFVELVRHDKP